MSSAGSVSSFALRKHATGAERKATLTGRRPALVLTALSRKRLTPRRALVEPAGARLAVLVRLPDPAGADVEGGQPAVAVNPGVDADGVADRLRPTGLLRRVPADHDLPRLVRGGRVK